MDLSIILYEIGKWSGIAGFTFLFFLIFSGDTAKFWDKFFGLDKIIKFQKKFSYFTAVFIVLHSILFVIAEKKIMYFIIPNFTIIPLALGIIAFYLFITIMIASAIYKRISHTAWQYIHIVIYMLFFSSIYHAFKWGSSSEEWHMQIIYVGSLVFIIIGIIYRTWYKIKGLYAGKYFVKDIHWETKDTFTLIIRQEKKLKFATGQFCFLRINKNKLYARHPLTISSSPNEEYLHFTIKNTGRFTQTASELKIGEEVFVEGPFGVFTKKDTQNDIVFLAGGSGITPFMSMIRDNLYNKIEQNIMLIYGSKTKTDIIFKDELTSIDKKWFKKVFVLSQDEKKNHEDYEYGRITKEIIQNHVKNINNSIFYICGPKTMKESLIRILHNLGVKNKNIFCEEFFW